MGAAGEGTAAVLRQHAVAEPPPGKQAPVQLEQQVEGRGRSAEMALFGSHRRRGAAAGRLGLHAGCCVIWGIFVDNNMEETRS